MTKIKICGVTREEDALLAAGHGADFLGMIFVPESQRYVEAGTASSIAERLRALPHVPKIVGVFRDASPADVRRIVKEVGLDFVQLHGAEGDDELAEIGVPAIKTVRVGDALPDTTSHPSAAWLLFDTYDERRAGGTGRRFDWSLLAIYERAQPFFLSGGINPENVAAAISLVRPDAVDVASGVESAPGIKDPKKLEQFFERVRRT